MLDARKLAFLDAAAQLLHVRIAVCRCNVLLKHEVVPDTLFIAAAV